MSKLLIPMCHHFESTRADSELGSLAKVSNLEFLLEKDRRLLIGKFDNPCNKYMMR